MWSIKLACVQYVCVAALAILLAATPTVHADFPPSKFGMHEPVFFRCAIVTDLVLSPDGRNLATAYFMPASNRQRTNWDAWVAVWNLTTGKRTIIPNATSPLAVSPDGEWLAMGLYERSMRSGFYAMPPLSLALWRMEEVQPVHKLDREVGPEQSEDTPARLLACAFSSDGKEILAIRDDGCLLAWETAGESLGKKVGSLTLPNIEQVKLGPEASLLATKNGGIYLLASFRNYPSDRQVYGVEVSWYKLRSQWSRNPPRLFKACTRHYIFYYPSNYSNNPFALSLPKGLEPSDVAPNRKSYNPLPQSRTVVSPNPKPGIIAFRLSDVALAVVRRIRGEQLSQFPAVAVHAFTPDSKQLIVSDRRGVLRFWDVATGQIVRTLRLDDKPSDTFLVAAIQTPTTFGRPDLNRRKLADAVRSAAFRGAEIVVLPETAVTGYMSADLKQTWRVGDRPVSKGLTGVDPKDAAETVPGPSTKFFSDIARQCGIYLTVPLLETDRKTGKYYNTVVLIGPDGSTLIHYRKLNPWPWAEKGWASEGNLGRPVVDTPFGRFGVLICYDIHKQAEELAKLKIDTLLYSIAWVDDRESDWFPERLPLIAADNGFNIVAANWSIPREVPEPSWHGYGQSLVVDSVGNVLAKAKRKNDEEIIFAELPLPKREKSSPIDTKNPPRGDK